MRTPPITPSKCHLCASLMNSDVSSNLYASPTSRAADEKIAVLPTAALRHISLRPLPKLGRCRHHILCSV